MKIAVTIDTEKDLGILDSYLGIDEGLPVILALLNKYAVKGTFFVSGDTLPYLAGKGLLSKIENDGHEIASHGYHHTDYRDWEYDRILQETGKSKSVLERVIRGQVTGFRAPQFLINEKILRALRECGFLYDSSIPDGKGISAARCLRKVKVDDSLHKTVLQSGMKEFTIGSLPFLKIPHGLLWLNIISLPVYRLLFNHLSGNPLIFYLHPFDMIRDKQRVNLDLKRKLFYLKNGNKISELLEGLIRFWIQKGVEFVRLGDLL